MPTLTEDAPTPDVDERRVTEQGTQHYEVNDDHGYRGVWKKTVHLGALVAGHGVLEPCVPRELRRGSFTGEFFIKCLLSESLKVQARWWGFLNALF